MFVTHKCLSQNNVRRKRKQRNKRPTCPNWVLAICFSSSKSFPVKSFCYKRENIMWDTQIHIWELSASLVAQKHIFCSTFSAFSATGNGSVLTAPLGTQTARTEPPGWPRADWRNSISVERKIWLRSISCTNRQIKKNHIIHSCCTLNKRVKDVACSVRT